MALASTQRWAIPKPGIVIRFPTNKVILPEKGATVPWTGRDGKYWRRRLSDGSIDILMDIPTPAIQEITQEIKKEKPHKKYKVKE